MNFKFYGVKRLEFTEANAKCQKIKT